MAERLKPGGIFLLNTPYSADEVWSRLPQEVRATLNQKKRVLRGQRGKDRPRMQPRGAH